MEHIVIEIDVDGVLSIRSTAYPKGFQIHVIDWTMEDTQQKEDDPDAYFAAYLKDLGLTPEDLRYQL